MATEPKRPDDSDNVVSLRAARARAEARARADKNRQTGQGDRKLPALLIFLGLLAVFVAMKFLLG